MNSDEIDGGRRRVLKLVGVGGTAAAAMATAVATEAYQSPEEQLKSRYRINDHIERYYFLNRL